MKLTKKQLAKIIKEELEIVTIPASQPAGRDLGYGEGEGKMTKSQLYKVAEYGQKLHDMIGDDDNLPEWVQSKIAVMAHDIGKIKHYLDYKILRMSEAMQAPGSYDDDRPVEADRMAMLNKDPQKNPELAGYRREAKMLGVNAAKLVAQHFDDHQSATSLGATIENEIHLAMDKMGFGDEERWGLADEALSVAGIVMGIGPDAL